MTDNKLPYDEIMYLEQFAKVLGFVTHMQGEERTERACAEAKRKCAELFELFSTADNDIEYMTMLGYLTMDLAASIGYIISRVADINHAAIREVEQWADAATLGSESVDYMLNTIGKLEEENERLRSSYSTLTAEQVEKAIYAHSIHADCADADWQAIADELNAELRLTEGEDYIWSISCNSESTSTTQR